MSFLYEVSIVKGWRKGEEEGLLFNLRGAIGINIFILENNISKVSHKHKLIFIIISFITFTTAPHTQIDP